MSLRDAFVAGALYERMLAECGVDDAFTKDGSRVRAEAERRYPADPQGAPALRGVLVKAAIPLEVLAGQITVKPYAEMTADFQRIIVETVAEIRAALAAWRW
jgi:hypothetical protein